MNKISAKRLAKLGGKVYSTIGPRKTWLAKGTKPIPQVRKGPSKRQAKYQAFLRSKAWRDQKKRVHQRDGWQCTEVIVVERFSKDPWTGLTHRMQDLFRCHYTKDDGPLHADHESYGHRGLEAVPDEKIKTKCPQHHMNKDGWKAFRAIQGRKG